ncbi:MAG TPA: excinuclease ABC subunit UvrB [Candidatus Paceibacterota bacterium]
MANFKISAKFKPAGDQPQAIEALVKGLEKGLRHNVLLGVTGSGKTFTVANVIEKIQKPTLVIAHNKTLAAQLAQEYKEFFPENAVHYFVSYYDYYQPEAYMPITDTYIEKDAQINEEIDRLRHASTQALLTRKDVIIVASVSCIYGLGSPAEYENVNIKVKTGEPASRNEFLRKLTSLYYKRTTADLTPGTFRAIGTSVEVMPVSERVIYRIVISRPTATFVAVGRLQIIENIQVIDPINQTILNTPESFFIFPAKHFVTSKKDRARAVKAILKELSNQVAKFEKEGKLLEADRIKRRTLMDVSMLREVGYCSGIENYSRHLSGRTAGEPPDTLLSYFPKDLPDGQAGFLTVIDESHVTMPQIRGMYEGDRSRKQTLIEYGFRLPSALDNRPLKFPEFIDRVGSIVYTSATPGKYELEEAPKDGQVTQQIIRPTGLIDPEIEIRPVSQRSDLKNSERSDLEYYPGQVKNMIEESKKVVKRGNRVIATTLTKKMAEDLAGYLKEQGMKAEYLHSEIKTLERIKILTEFRRGTFDVLVGVNLLREGLDLPEVSFIGILDADKEGFLRSETSLIQTIGRAARNVEGKVILYADKITDSIKKAVGETNRRREIQVAYNKKHGITPETIIKEIKDITEQLESEHDRAVAELLVIDKRMYEKDPKKLIRQKEKEMVAAVKELDFETAAILRDEIKALRGEV